jgi:hypothetical protein
MTFRDGTGSLKLSALALALALTASTSAGAAPAPPGAPPAAAPAAPEPKPTRIAPVPPAAQPSPPAPAPRLTRIAPVAPAAPPAPAPEPKPIRIKNGHTIRVVLGKKREPAAGVRPDKDGWRLVLAPELAGSSADLQDITPGLPGSHWALAVTAEPVVLDPERFLASHVYRVELRKERQLLGTAIVYLYPPPTPKETARVEFQDDKDGEDKPTSLAPTQKGSLADDRSSGRAKAPR